MTDPCVSAKKDLATMKAGIILIVLARLSIVTGFTSPILMPMMGRVSISRLQESEAIDKEGHHADGPVVGGKSVIDAPSLPDETATTTIWEESAADISKDLIEEHDENDNRDDFDAAQMQLAIDMAKSVGGERGPTSPFPKPVSGAVIVRDDGKVLGRGKSDYSQDAVVAAIQDVGLVAAPLKEWVVSWPYSRQLREDLAKTTLYVTLEPSCERKGDSLPPITQLIEQSGIGRVVIGTPDPILERATEGAATLHSLGISVTMGVEEEACRDLIKEYEKRANSKLHKMARNSLVKNGLPLGFLHCSVVESNNIEAFARQGNAFGKDFGGQRLSYRDFGSYEIAPPPDVVWADETDAEDLETEVDSIFSIDFDEEFEQETMAKNPMMPWYEQVDAVVVTFPRAGNGPADDDSVTARLNGLRWLATQGESLPPNVERILVMDATDLKELPITNDSVNLPEGVDVEGFWKGDGRRKTRLLLRRGHNAQAQAAAEAAKQAAAAAAEAAQAALDAVESGDAADAASAALECQQAAAAATQLIQEELSKIQALKQTLMEQGVQVESLSGGEPIDVMRHLAKRNGYESVVWRAGCWGERGVKAILAGAFQWVSAHLAVDAVGGRFWQLMIAERAVQAACGPERKVKIFAEQEDISLEFCDEAEADSDCVLKIDGQPVRHVRLDCRVALVDETRPREFVKAKTTPLTQSIIQEEAPWFL